jgi:hypothetical protein
VGGPGGTLGGDLSGHLPNPTLVGTANVESIIRANTLDQMGAPAANVSWNSKKIINLANGSAAQDAAAFGQIPVPANGYGITGNTGLTPTPAVALATVAATLASNTALSSGTTSLVTSPSLAVGTWDLTLVLCVYNNAALAAAQSLYFNAAAGTATLASGAGPSLAYITLPAVASASQAFQSAAVRFILVVSGAGTIILQAGGASSSITAAGGFGQTGLTAVRIA